MALTLATTDRLAALEILEERVPDAILIEFANLLVSFEASEANGHGALYFNANHGKAQQWGVRSDTVASVNCLTRRVKRA